MHILAIAAATAFFLASCTAKTPKYSPETRQFKTETLLKYTPVKDQRDSPLCWAYAMLATIETEHIMEGDSVNLSPDFTARQWLAEQARQSFLSGGSQPVSCRGMATTLLNLLSRYGTMPYDAYNSSTADYPAISRRIEMAAKASPSLEQAQRRADDILDQAIGSLPLNVYMFGAEYTPLEFAHSVCMKGEYTALTSFTHHPFGQPFVLETPDNAMRDAFVNLPIDSLMAVAVRSIRAGHPVCWEGDITEAGFSFGRGLADTPSPRPCTQQQRQRDFSLRRTTDDHAMALVGLARDSQGRLYFIAKNSWGTRNPYGGMMYLSENYVRLKTVALVVKTELLWP